MNTAVEFAIDLPKINQSRLYIYELLQKLLGEPPEPSTLQLLVEDESFKSLTSFSEGAKLIYEYVELVLRKDQVFYSELKQEYNRLFIGPTILPAPLWESVYLSKEHLMFEEETLKVREFYQRFDLSFERINQEPEDHIVVELEFLAILIAQTLAINPIHEKEKMLEYMTAQIEFLQEHLLKWTPQFCELLLNATDNQLFQGIAILLAEYLPCDIDVAINLREAFRNE